MQLTIQTPATADLEAYATLPQAITRRAEQALERFAPAIRSVSLRISDINGPRGGYGIACRGVVQLANGGTVVIKGLARNAVAAAQEVIDRARAAVAREIERRRDRR